MPCSEAVARNTTLSATAAHGRRSADAGDPGPGGEVWAVRVSAHHGVVAERGMAGREGSSAADLATRRAESTAETAAARAVVAGRWFVCTVATGAGESCVELRFCEGDDARWAGAADAGGDRRVYAGVFGVAGGATFREFAGDRDVGGCDVGARDPRAHSFRQWAGVHCQGVEEVAGECGHEDDVHRAGEPVGNGYCESFNGKLRDEFLNGEIFYSLKEAQILMERWRVEYNTERPHSALGYRPPAPQAILPKQTGHGDMENASRFPHPHTPGGYDGQISNNDRPRYF